jgi:hypothetical protein
MAKNRNGNKGGEQTSAQTAAAAGGTEGAGGTAVAVAPSTTTDAIKLAHEANSKVEQAQQGLMARREALMAELETVREALRAMGANLPEDADEDEGSGRRGGRGRGRGGARKGGRRGGGVNESGTRGVNEQPLYVHIARFLKRKGDKGARVMEIADGVVANGYNSTSNNLRTIVNQTLGNNDKWFKNIARGVYILTPTGEQALLAAPKTAA